MQRDVTSKRILIYSFKTTFMALKAIVIIGEGIMIVLFDYVFLHQNIENSNRCFIDKNELIMGNNQSFSLSTIYKIK